MRQVTLFDLFTDLVGPAPVPTAKPKREPAVFRSEMAPCYHCGRYVLIRPSYCYSCCRELGLDPNSTAPSLDAREPEGSDPEREARIERYAARAAAGLPLFEESARVPEMSETEAA